MIHVKYVQASVHYLLLTGILGNLKALYLSKLKILTLDSTKLSEFNLIHIDNRKKLSTSIQYSTVEAWAVIVLYREIVCGKDNGWLVCVYFEFDVNQSIAGHVMGLIGQSITTLANYFWWYTAAVSKLVLSVAVSEKPDTKSASGLDTS